MILTSLKYIVSTFLIVGLAMSSGVYAILLYFKITESPLATPDLSTMPLSQTVEQNIVSPSSSDYNDPSIMKERKTSIIIEAPLVLQNPELPSGCELTALTMLLQFYGVRKSKMDLLPEMKRDTTPIRWKKNGTIEYWGNPNLGYVGDITGKQKGFGIYHSALYELLANYVPTAVDLSGSPFSKIENQLSDGIPVVAWTTIPFTVPQDDEWVIWDSPLGPIKTTFLEHAVLLVGYDEEHVYVNDPLSGKKNFKIEKEQFVKTWEAMGRQALTYERA